MVVGSKNLHLTLHHQSLGSKRITTSATADLNTVAEADLAQRTLVAGPRVRMHHVLTAMQLATEARRA